MAVGPCGIEFREAFSCFHYSKSEVKGSECLEQFAKLQLCMKDFPELYEEKNRDAESGEDSKMEEGESTKDTQATKEEAVEVVMEDSKTDGVIVDTEKQPAL